MITTLQDIKYGLRMMARTPVVSLVAVMSLSLGIAGVASVLSLANSFLYEPLPYENQDELVLFRSLRTGQGIEMAGGVSVPNFRDYEEGSQRLESSMLYMIEEVNLTGLDVPEQLSVVIATPGLFEVLGVQPGFGRNFRSEEGAEGSGNVLILEYDYWQRRFLGDRDVLGRVVTLDGTPHTVIGVMPEDFDIIPANVHAFRPSDFADQVENRATRGFLAFARLKDGASVEQVQAEVDAVHARLVTEFPETNRGTEVVVQSAREFFPGPTDRQLVKILMAVTLFGLLIACANVANLLLGRAEERQKEIAVRTAMGAGRARIIRQLLTESVLMAGSAAAVGALLARWVVQWMRGAMPAQMPEAVFPSLEPEVLGVTLFVSLLAGVAFGLAPALHSARGDLRESLGNGARGGTAGRRRKRLRNSFVVGEVAVALALLTGSGFLIQAFQQLANADPGFEATGLLTFQLSALDDRYEDDESVAAFQGEVLRVLAEIPRVDGVAVMSSLPRAMSGSRTRYTVDGREALDPIDQPTAGLQVVNAGYFETMSIPLRSGRLFTEADQFGSEPVALVSESFGTREFGGEDPIDRQITVAGSSRRIVGVVPTILQERMRIAGRAGEQIYLPASQAALRSAMFAVRTTDDPSALADEVRQAVWSVESDQPVANLQTLQAAIDESLAGPQSLALFLSLMGGMALALAAMGIYGVMSHSVMQQQRDIGVRMALGAGRGTVVGLIARSGLSLVGVGVVAGLPLSFLMYRGTMTGMGLFEAEVGFRYPLALAGALIAVAVLATVLPAQRASGVTPVMALKE
jgi:putative ABC transport system permease protein